ncbi:MAG: tRNA 5-methoxyuridine(34)/uridine 5-oxyacetic acid(34) synthase CmoB [Candidatus Symbiodolus clandestinus]
MVSLNSTISSLSFASTHPRWQTWLNHLPQQLITWQQTSQYLLFQRAWHWVEQLPWLCPTTCDLQHAIRVDGQLLATTADNVNRQPTAWKQQIYASLHQLKPWRKGPFNLYGITIDSEWRSDWKWQRLLPHITPLTDHLVLDVGCANGYYLWRMVGAGAKYALGIDPMGRFLAQFTAVQKLIGSQYPLGMLPFTLEQLPALEMFDSVFSMGILYHRRDPLQHLTQLLQQLRPGGELLLETLILPDNTLPLLIPTKRYSQMRNVYAIPSATTLLTWLTQSGFHHPILVDISRTTPDEQRCTAWSGQRSLADFLDPTDDLKTIEGYPAPQRAITIAKRPR